MWLGLVFLHLLLLQGNTEADDTQERRENKEQERFKRYEDTFQYLHRYDEESGRRGIVSYGVGTLVGYGAGTLAGGVLNQLVGGLKHSNVQGPGRIVNGLGLG